MNLRKAFPVAALCALAVPATAAAHANVIRTIPANGSVLARSPADVRIVFDDTVSTGPGIEAIRNGGASILAGRATVERGRTLVVPLRRALPNGDYSVRWAIVSNDGHLESGVVAFAVGIGRAPPLAGLSAEATGPPTSSVLARSLFFIGLLSAVGLALFLLVTRQPFDDRIPLMLSTACVLVAAGAGDEVHRVGLSTRDGTALGAGFVLALVVASLAAAATLERRALRPALWLAVLLAPVPSFAGHALDPGLTRLNVVADVLHVAGASAWVGALLGVLLFRVVAARLAIAGVALLGVTGITRAAFELTSASQLWNTSYGRTLLVKTALLLAALALGLLRRRRVEIVVVAGILVAAAVLVQLKPGRNFVTAQPAAASSFAPAPPPPPTAPDAIIEAREAGPLAVVLAAEAQKTTVIVLSPSGGGQSGLDVRVDGHATSRCGSGCYVTAYAHGPRVALEVAGRHVTFAVPAAAPPAEALVHQVFTRFRMLRSVVYREHLASDPQHAITALWRLEKPAKLTYAITGGADAIVIGTRRWDRDGVGKPWQESPQTPLPQPVTQWVSSISAHVIAQTKTTETVTFADPSIPAYFDLVLDKATLLPRLLHMVAPAHFMTDRYLSFNAPPVIRPPR